MSRKASAAEAMACIIQVEKIAASRSRSASLMSSETGLDIVDTEPLRTSLDAVAVRCGDRRSSLRCPFPNRFAFHTAGAVPIVNFCRRRRNKIP